MQPVAIIGGGPSGIAASGTALGNPIAAGVCLSAKAPNADAFFDFLRSLWEIERRIPEMQASLHGTAQFVRAPAYQDMLDYREEGELHLSRTGEKFHAFRNYRYVREPGGLAAYFADGPDIGKLFHRLKPAFSPQAPSAVTLEGDHHCGNDDYYSIYRVIGEDRFDVVHRVTGPAKNYTSTTIYRRLSPEMRPNPES